MSNRVLIVDDNVEIVQATSARLRAAGYETICAFDGAQGVRLATTDSPDAIVLDVRMPVQDGMTALAELKRRDDTRDIPVVMVSASVVDQHTALESGARFFLRKPHDGRKLVDALNTIVSSKRPAACSA